MKACNCGNRRTEKPAPRPYDPTKKPTRLPRK